MPRRSVLAPLLGSRMVGDGGPRDGPLMKGSELRLQGFSMGLRGFRGYLGV